MLDRRLRKRNRHNPLLALLYAVAILLLLFAGINWVIKSAYFPVKYNKIESKNPPFKHLNAVHLRTLAQQSIANNIFRVNLNQVKADFEQNPWVKNADVQRVWPDTVVVKIEERVPLARWKEVQLIDEDGQLFNAPSDEVLPYLDGPKHSEQKILSIYREISQQLATVPLRISRFSCDARLSCEMVLDNGIRVKLGREKMAERTARLVGFWQSIFQEKVADLVYIDLRYQEAFAIKERKVGKK